jgi:molecular chaperone HtpG
MWESNSKGSFSVSQVDYDLKRGTAIKLYLKDSEKTYLDESKLREIIQKHLQFINFDIQLLCFREKEESEEDKEEREEKEDLEELEGIDKKIDSDEQVEQVEKKQEQVFLLR